jgi:hypothetical protein
VSSNLGYCWKCNQRGHACEAQTTDVDDKPICIFCADGVPCPTQQRLARAPQPAEEPKVPGPAKPTGDEAMRSSETEQHECGFEGCKNLTNKKYCKKCAAKIWYREHRGKVAKVVAGKRTCASCSATLRADNKSGVCTSCQRAGKRPVQARLEKNNGAPLKEVPKKWNRTALPVVRETTEAGIATICVTEERLDHFLLTLPIETKAEIASEYLGRN